MPIRFNAPPSIGRATRKYGTWRCPSPARQLSGQLGEGVLDDGDDLIRFDGLGDGALRLHPASIADFFDEAPVLMVMTGVARVFL
jgi:hypothetical protein